MDHPFNIVITLCVHCAGERYFAYISEAQQMVSEFGETLGPLETEEEMDSILPCSATLYLTSNSILNIHSQLIVHLALFFVHHTLRY